MEDLYEYLDEQAAYIAQSSAYSYCRARTGFMAPKLFAEAEFVVNLDRSKWATYLAVLEDLLITLEWEMRGWGLAPEALHAGLCDVYNGILSGRPRPPEREEPWPKADDGFARRLAQSQMAAPKTTGELSQHSGKVLFNTVPIHPDMKNIDEEMVVNSVRFRLLRFAEELPARLDAAALRIAMGAAPDSRAGQA